MAAPHIARGEDAGAGTHVGFVGFDVATLIELNAELFDHAVAYGAGEAHREKNKVGRVNLLAARNRLELRCGADTNRVQLFDIAFGVAGELRSRHGELAHAAFFMRAFLAQHQGPQRPWRRGRALVWRFRHDLELRDRSRFMAVRRAEAVRAGVAASDDDDVFAGGEDIFAWIQGVARASLVLLRQELHGEVDSSELATRHRNIARLFGSAG